MKRIFNRSGITLTSLGGRLAVRISSQVTINEIFLAVVVRVRMLLNWRLKLHSAFEEKSSEYTCSLGAVL